MDRILTSKHVLKICALLFAFIISLLIWKSNKEIALANSVSKDVTVNFTINPKVKYSNGNTYDAAASKIKDYSAVIKREDTEVYSGNLKSGDKVTFTSSDAGEYKITLNNCSFSDSTEVDTFTATTSSGISVDPLGESLTFDLGEVEIKTKTQEPLVSKEVTVNFNITPKVKYSNGNPYDAAASKIKDYSAVIKRENTEVYSGNLKSGDKVTFTSSDAGEYKITLNNCSFSDSTEVDTFTATTSSGISVDPLGESLTFDLGEVEIKTKTQEPPAQYELESIRATDQINISISDAKDINKVKAKLPSKFNATVKIKNTTNTEEWTNATATVSWSTDPTGYDNTKKKPYSFTWSGDVNTSTIVTKNDGTTTADVPSKKTVTVTYNVIGDSSYYDSAIDDYDDKLKAEVSDGDYTLNQSNFNKEMVKRILKYYIDENKDSTIVNAIKNAIDNDKKITLVLKATKTDVGSSKEEKFEDEVDEDKKGAKIGKYFDLTLKMKIEGETNSISIHDTGSDNKLKISITAPSSIQKTSRTFNIARDHDGIDILNDEYKSSNKVEFSTHYFSNYAISYYDGSSSSSSSSSAASNSNSRSTLSPGTGTTSGNAAGGGGSAGGGKAPKTGDDFNAKKWVFFLVIGVVVALCSFILYQDTKEWRDENK